MFLPPFHDPIPAAGASVKDLLIGGGIAAVYFGITGWLLIRERRGHRTLLGRFFDWFGDRIGLPGWAAGPVIAVPLLTMLEGFGVWWDVPIHMQRGRDAGAFTNPGHWPIYFGLLGLLAFALIIAGMAREPLPARTLRPPSGLTVPYSSVILTLAGLIAVIGFPLDDIWHRIFGQDVTEWGPTHVMMIGGAITAPLTIPLLLAESRQVGARLMTGKAARWVMLVALGFCIAPFAFLMEFDLGVPQFPASTQGIIFCFITAWVFLASRLWFGPGGALISAGLWWFFHFYVWGTVSLLPHVLTVQWLLAVPAAVIIELVALLWKPEKRSASVLPFAAICGLLTGSLGYVLEWVWSHGHMPPPQPFPAHALWFLVPISTVAGLGGALLAVWHVRRLQQVAGDIPGDSSLPILTRDYRRVGLAGLVTFLVLMTVFAPPLSGKASDLTVRYTGITTGAEDCTSATVQCLATVTVKFDGTDSAKDAIWFYGFAWQGYSNRAVEPLSAIPNDPEAHVPGIIRTRFLATGVPGEYRSEYKLPLYGTWKTMVRLHLAPNTMLTYPLYFPEDAAIASTRGREIRATNGSVLKARYEPDMLQRERKDSIPQWVYAAGNAIVLSMWVVVLFLFGWAYNRAAGTSVPRRSKAGTQA